MLWEPKEGVVKWARWSMVGHFMEEEADGPSLRGIGLF